jgi:hypothetical protein
MMLNRRYIEDIVITGCVRDSYRSNEYCLQPFRRIVSLHARLVELS